MPFFTSLLPSSSELHLHFPPARSRTTLKQNLHYPLPVRIPPATVQSTTTALFDMATERNRKRRLIDNLRNLRIEEVHGMCASALPPFCMKSPLSYNCHSSARTGLDAGGGSTHRVPQKTVTVRLVHSRDPPHIVHPKSKIRLARLLCTNALALIITVFNVPSFHY